MQEHYHFTVRIIVYQKTGNFWGVGLIITYISYNINKNLGHGAVVIAQPLRELNRCI